jgi:hypothetical protein
MITPIKRAAEKPVAVVPEVKYITFLSFPEYYCHGKVREDAFIAHGHECDIVMVARCEIEGFTKNDYRMMASTPAVMGLRDRGFDQCERKKALLKFAGHPKFNFGQYYDLDCLLLMDDIVEYGHSGRKFENIRSARDFVKQNKHHKK